MLSTATRNSTACFNKRLVGLKAVTSHKLSCALNLQGRRTGGAAPELARPPGDFSRTAPASLGTKLQRARRERRHRRTFGHHLWETSRVWEESRQPQPHGGAAPSLRGLLHPTGCRSQTLPATSQPGSELSEGPGQPVPPGRAGPGRRCPQGRSAFRAGCGARPAPPGPVQEAPLATERGSLRTPGLSLQGTAKREPPRREIGTDLAGPGPAPPALGAAQLTCAGSASGWPGRSSPGWKRERRKAETTFLTLF